ncbi:MAG: hypothetical protein A3K10_10345 [Bacteroidetes bacterium RIFCSPLOWO2_12_FULL_31_6]|nr:MAG: hypothetical protein A3K10_10345 [Bacteroidetes bacterium RIFCSPLOWO2_12_FULL_31_6]
MLTERGILDAYLIADCFVKDKRKIPQVIYSSPAARAIHTAIIFSRVSGYVVDRIIINPFLYGATEHELITEIIKLDDKNTTVMFWGHNDGLTHLVNHLINTEHIDNLPTAAIACIDFEVLTWKEIEKNKGTLQFLYRPKEYKKEI